MTNIGIWIGIDVWVISYKNIASTSKCWTIIWMITNCVFSFVCFECKLVVVVELKHEWLSAAVRTVWSKYIVWIPFARSESTDDLAHTCFDDCIYSNTYWYFLPKVDTSLSFLYLTLIESNEYDYLWLILLLMSLKLHWLTFPFLKILHKQMRFVNRF